MKPQKSKKNGAPAEFSENGLTLAKDAPTVGSFDVAMKNKPPATLRDLAEHLGLGITTVSDILLRQKTNYSDKTIQRVREASLSFGYHPNALAQGIRRGKTQTIGLLITFNILDPFFAELVNRLEKRFEAEKFMVLLSISENEIEKDQRTLRFFESRRVDGIIAGPIYKRNAIESVQHHYQTRLPAVFFLCDTDAPNDTVSIIEKPPGYIGHMAVKYFLDRGHRKIGYLMCPEGPRSDVGSQVYRGFHQSLHAKGLFEEKWVWVENRPLADVAYQQMKKILKTTPKKALPTAFYCHNDHCAIGAMAAAREAGYRIPQDFSFIGTDNIISSAFAVPPLTTIDLHPGDIADSTFELMMRRLRNPLASRSRRTITPTLVERDSVAKLR